MALLADNRIRDHMRTELDLTAQIRDLHSEIVDLKLHKTEKSMRVELGLL